MLKQKVDQPKFKWNFGQLTFFDQVSKNQFELGQKQVRGPRVRVWAQRPRRVRV